MGQGLELAKIARRDPTSFLSILAGERVRVAFQLVQLIQSDLTNEDVKFQPAQLIQLQKAVDDLSDQLDRIVGKVA